MMKNRDKLVEWFHNQAEGDCLHTKNYRQCTTMAETLLGAEWFKDLLDEQNEHENEGDESGSEAQPEGFGGAGGADPGAEVG